MSYAAIHSRANHGLQAPAVRVEVHLSRGLPAFTIVGSVALVSELSPAGGRGRNMGVYNSFRLFGFGAGPLAAGFV